MANRTRDTEIRVRVTPEEREQILAKMAQYGTTNISAFIRKMAIDGYVIHLELPELREILSLLRRVSNNINQIARRANETRRVYDTDLQEIARAQEQLTESVGQILAALSKLE